jgi:hypothetical protein
MSPFCKVATIFGSRTIFEVAKHPSKYSVLLSVKPSVYGEDRFLNAVNQNSVHVVGRRVVILAVKIDAPEPGTPAVIFPAAFRISNLPFRRKIYFAPGIQTSASKQ